MKVYMVTDGYDSDYGVCGVYSTPEKAEEARALLNTENEVEEWDVDAALPEHPIGQLPYEVLIQNDGTVTSVRRLGLGFVLETAWVPLHPDVATVNVRTWARDAAHATDIAKALRGELIATHQWTTNYWEWAKREVKGQSEAAA